MVENILNLMVYGLFKIKKCVVQFLRVLVMQKSSFMFLENENYSSQIYFFFSKIWLNEKKRIVVNFSPIVL